MPQTDSTLAGITIQLTDSAGLITNCISSGAFPTTASKFAVGCSLTDSTTGQGYYNSGTVAVPVWSVESDLLTATVSLAAADIIAMQATPIAVVPAVSGKTIFIDSATLKMVRTSTAFTGGGVVVLQWGTAATGGGPLAVGSQIAAAHVTGSAGTFYTNVVGPTLTTTQNTSLEGIGIYVSNGTAAFASGTGTGTLYVRYHLI